MDDTNFHEPVDWGAVALAFVVWAAHFSVLWGASSALPGTPTARWIALAATIAGLTVLAELWRSRSDRGAQAIPRLAHSLAGVAMVLGALPALIG